MKTIHSSFDPVSGVLTTELRGVVTVDDVEAWRAGLDDAVAAIPDGASIRVLYDLRGFEPVEIAAHKAMRAVVPELLARHGLRPAVADLFDERPEVHVSIERGVRCVAFANVHHDEAKMARYEREIGKPDQRFFTDRDAAEAWLLRYEPAV